MSGGPLGNVKAAGGSGDAAISSSDPTALMRIKSLQLRARSVVEGYYNGLHRSPFHGFSVEFNEYRPYTVGDDLRALDWKLFARSDRYYIKKFEDETTRRCYLLLDQSRSMQYGTLEYDKLDYARTLTATLAHFLSLQRDNVGLMTFDAEIADYISARSRPGHLRSILAALSRSPAGKTTDLDGPLRQIAALVRRRGLVVLISDLLAPLDSLRRNLAYLRSRGHEVMILRTLDPGESDLKISQPGMITDMESGREIYLDPEAARDGYRQKFARHAEELKTTCDSLGVDLFDMPTDGPLEQSLFHIVSVRNRRGGGANRAGMLAAGGGR